MRLSKPALIGFFLLFAPQGAWTQSTSTVTAWYNGDCHEGIPGLANWYVSDQTFTRVFDDFTVPGSGWIVASVLSLNSMRVSGVTEAIWEIRSGVSAGNAGSLVTFGRSPATQTLLYTLPDGENIYRIEVDGLGVRLGAGTYWLNVSPVVDQTALAASGAPSYVCATTGTNSVGTPSGNDGNGYVDSPGSPDSFAAAQTMGSAGTTGDFSQGIGISTSTPPVPSVSAVVSAASWQSGAVSPGELVAITGASLGPSAPSTLLLDRTGKVSAALDGVQVLFNGIAAPEIYVGAAQINTIVPYELAGVANPSVQITAAGQTSAAFPLKLASAVPALFTADGSGSGPAAALNSDSTYNQPGHPAPKGSYIVLFMTGEGLTSSPSTGAITTVSPSPPLSPQPILTPVTVLIGGQQATVAFYGEAPGLVSGVLQINAQIPTTAPSGSVPVSVSLGGITTREGVTISVQ